MNHMQDKTNEVRQMLYPQFYGERKVPDLDMQALEKRVDEEIYGREKKRIQDQKVERLKDLEEQLKKGERRLKIYVSLAALTGVAYVVLAALEKYH